LGSDIFARFDAGSCLLFDTGAGLLDETLIDVWPALFVARRPSGSTLHFGELVHGTGSSSAGAGFLVDALVDAFLVDRHPRLSTLDDFALRLARRPSGEVALRTDASAGAANILCVRRSAKLSAVPVSLSDFSESPSESSAGGVMNMSAETNERVPRLSISSFSDDDAMVFLDRV